MIRIVIVTLLVYWAVGMIIDLLINTFFPRYYSNDFLAAWGVGLLFPVMYVVFYPIRAWNTYSKNKRQYIKAGISRGQYLLGRRIRASSMNPIARRIWKGKSNDDGGNE